MGVVEVSYELAWKQSQAIKGYAKENCRRLNIHVSV